MRFQPNTPDNETLVMDFGPLSLVVQRTTTHETRSYTFHYSEIERTAMLDWFYDTALDCDEGVEFKPIVFNAFDATWEMEARESFGSLWIDIQGMTPGNPRKLDFIITPRELTNLANSINQELAYTPNEYQRLTKTTANYYNCGLPPVAYTSLGLAGEAGELANKVKKIFRDGEGYIAEEDEIALMDEAGDCLWYIARLLDDMGISLEDAMKHNIRKLHSRAARGVIAGTGDNR